LVTEKSQQTWVTITTEGVERRDAAANLETTGRRSVVGSCLYVRKTKGLFQVMQESHVEFGDEDLQLIRESTFVASLDYHDSIPSTNDHALSLLSKSALRTPALILTARQTAGRGRGSNRWWSTAGSLTFSLVLNRQDLGHPFQWSQISLTAGLAVCDALHDLRPGLEIGLKWPNDVLVRNRKICGILVEVPPSASHHAIVGIGLNVNNSLQDQALPLAPAATSLSDTAGYSFSLTDVLIRILNHLSACLRALNQDVDSLHRKWQTLCILTGQRVHVDVGTQRTTGICLGIDHDGALLIESAAGPTRCVSGVVTRLNN
jgi:BirA family biotin operon repressor/biotin-[acetyl-CoA-carboxylase] ligase